jgi:hypothetical protein
MTRRGRSGLLAIAVLALATTAGCSGSSSSYQGPPAADAALQAAFHRAVEAVDLPAGMTADPTMTACGGFATRCARTGESPRQVVTAFSALVTEAGGPSRPITCGTESTQPLYPAPSGGAVGCVMRVTHGQAVLDVRAWNGFALTPEPRTCGPDPSPGLHSNRCLGSRRHDPDTRTTADASHPAAADRHGADRLPVVLGRPRVRRACRARLHLRQAVRPARLWAGPRHPRFCDAPAARRVRDHASSLLARIRCFSWVHLPDHGPGPADHR